VIDQRILGGGSEAVETGRVDRFRLTGASEGATVAQVFGRMRVAGQVIWATKFQESTTTTGGGKGAGPKPKVTEYSYSISLAIALCEGEITRVGRIWADGDEIAPDDLNMRVYHGAADQLADPKIAATQGAEKTPAFRGVAYVVLEDLDLGQFGNRVPQFTFEVMRPSPDTAPEEEADLARQVRAVALIPGTGEYALAQTPAYLSKGFGQNEAINVNSASGKTDFETATDALQGELPNCGSALLVVSWFGDDLRCGQCHVQPKVEQNTADAAAMPWGVCGTSRAQAGLIAQQEGRPIYGGTPADASVVEAIQSLKSKGQDVVFYPFILMEQLASNGLSDPWSGASDQPILPWRGRITTSIAPGQTGSPDGTSAAEAEVDAFFGTTQAGDFSIDGASVAYNGPSDWRYRRFILHYAHLCAAAGGVSAFCIGSEMRSLTQIRGASGSFPAVDALRQLAAEVRSILGPQTKISYAADWSEYHGYQPAGTADKLFHLDPLWADPNIDFIGIDNYMPLSDWRDGEAHADVSAGSIYNLSYLSGNVAGGEGYDWYYPTQTARDAQRRSPITDGEGEPWIWRSKDLKGWWGKPHHDRVGGQRVAQASPWVPQSKPIWFTELGCAAIDKGTNQPNKFLDPKSSESQLPHYSNGMRDEVIQMQYLRAIYQHFAHRDNNPVSESYAAPMVAMERAHVWAWDTRPFPYFPGNLALWSDGDNYARGHWLNGRVSNRTLANVVGELCRKAGVTDFDVSALYGIVRGYTHSDISSVRAALQPLILTYGIDVAERDGKLIFRNRHAMASEVLDYNRLAQDPEAQSALGLTRAPKAEIIGRVQLEYIDAEADYEAGVAETVHPADPTIGVSRSTFPLAMTRAEGARTVSRWISEARVAQETLNFSLPPSEVGIGVGDVVAFDAPQAKGRYRIDRIEDAGMRLAEATRVEPEVYGAQPFPEIAAPLKTRQAATPVEMLFLDLPLLTGDEVPHAPHIAAVGQPWPGTVALYSAAQDSDYALSETITRSADFGLTETPLLTGPVATWDRQSLTVTFLRGGPTSVSPDAILAGANTFAIGDGSADQWEIVQAAQVQPIGDGQFILSQFLRGQAGSSGLMPSEWPAKSKVIVLDGTLKQLNLASGMRNQERHFRFGPAQYALGHESYGHEVVSFSGNGLRPYPVVHLRADGSADTQFSWIRQSRIDGDSWNGLDVPLAEDQELYQIQILQGNQLRRSEIVSEPQFTYAAAQKSADLSAGAYLIRVAQISARYGAGLSQELAVNH
jgi:hypothetical protein